VYRVHHLISLAGRVEGSNVVSHSRLDAVWQPLDSPAASRKNGVWGGGELDAIEMTRLVHFIFIREESDPPPPLSQFSVVEATPKLLFLRDNGYHVVSSSLDAKCVAAADKLEGAASSSSSFL
jgi:hypothetical protein